MAESKERLGGYTLAELLDTKPVSKSPKQIKQEEKASAKRGLVSTVLGAPFRLVAAIVKLPITLISKLVTGIVRAVTEVVKLPLRIVKALVSPFRG